MTFRCETCGTGLVYKGGPYKPRWCAEHREAAWKAENSNRQARYRQRTRAAVPPVYCAECGWRLLKPAELCGWCEVETGRRSEDELMEKVA